MNDACNSQALQAQVKGMELNMKPRGARDGCMMESCN